MKDDSVKLPPELAITETEWRVVQWLRTQAGCAYVAMITPAQKQRFDAFVRSMRDSPTVH